MITFDEAIKLSGDEPKSIMLGNGFSIEANPIFDYKNLFDKSELEQPLKELFKQLDTYDFEIVISELEHARSVLQIYSPQVQELISQIKMDSDILRKAFACAIIQDHATHQAVFNFKKGAVLRQRSCRKFLSHFSKIFTTNYDLLLYWEIMNEYEEYRKDGIFPMDDGFGSEGSKLIWHEPYKSNTRHQNVFYLHGSLFFRESSQGLIKEITGENSLLSEIQRNIIDRDQLPLIVLEGSHETKYEKICYHPYLKNSYDKLNSLSGNLFIFGHSLKSFDEHILNAIKTSKVNDIFVSKHSKDIDDEFQTRLNFFNIPANGKQSRQIYSFDAETAAVWV